MKKTKIAWLISLVIIAILTIWIISSYNQFVIINAGVDTAWAQVETQYQRRFDLIPNLVAATKGFLKQEQTVFGDIAKARTNYAGSSAGSSDRINATAQYESAISRLLVIMENYPELKSVETVRALTDELAGTENRVLVARDRYNELVRYYNVRVRSFPSNVLANVFGFGAKTFFEATTNAAESPKVEL